MYLYLVIFSLTTIDQHIQNHRPVNKLFVSSNQYLTDYTSNYLQLDYNETHLYTLKVQLEKAVPQIVLIHLKSSLKKYRHQELRGYHQIKNRHSHLSHMSQIVLNSNPH